MKTIRILSRHANVASAVAAAGLTRPLYENSLAEVIQMADKGSVRHQMEPCTCAFVVAPFSRTAEIYKDAAEVLFVTTAVIDGVKVSLLNKVELNGCMHDGKLSIAILKGDEFTTTIPAIEKSKAGRKILAQMQADAKASGFEVFGTDL